MVATKGTPYCRSALRASTLLLSNALRIAAVNWLCWFVVWMAKASGCSGRTRQGGGVVHVERRGETAVLQDEHTPAHTCQTTSWLDPHALTSPHDPAETAKP